MVIRNKSLWIVGAPAIVLLVVSAFLFFMSKDESLRLLYATSGGQYDSAAYDDFRQANLPSFAVEQSPLEGLTLRKLRSYDAVYLDVSLRHSDALHQMRDSLRQYVEQGGQLFLENDLLTDFPLDFLGASKLADIQAPSKPQFSFPEAEFNLRGMQKIIRLFSENFANHIGFDSLPGFRWGKGIVPSTAQTLVSMDGVALYAANRIGKGRIIMAGTFLPSRYFITGFDLQSGIDPEQGFSQRVRSERQKSFIPGAVYFDKKRIHPQPYFHFAFAAANYLLRCEFLDYVSKEKRGYSVKKVLGPYGRPAMAYQNHFEALPAFRDREAIQWGELLKTYRQIPSFSLVRVPFDWGKWEESVAVHLNTGTEQAPKFAGELPNSFYASGLHLMSDGRPFSLAAYPQYRSLSDPLESPYLAYIEFADMNGNGRADLLAGSADGHLYMLVNEGRNDAVYAWQSFDPPAVPVMDMLPDTPSDTPGTPAMRSTETVSVPSTDVSLATARSGLSFQSPDSFAEPRKLMLASGEPLNVGAYATVAAIDVNGDGQPDLLVGNENGEVLLAINKGKAVFTNPVAVYADNEPIRVSSHAAVAIGDIDGDGSPDLLVGDKEGNVRVYPGPFRWQRNRGEPQSKNVQGSAGGVLRFHSEQTVVRISAKYAAPSVHDINGDGQAELIVGNEEGDLLVYVRSGEQWLAQGPITAATLNQVGNNALVGGHYSVPRWYDINHDGKTDLIVGEAEFGTPVPIDDPQFPYQAQLREMLEYAKTNKLELYPHLFFHNYLSDEREKREIALHRAAFQKLGLPWTMTGTNQHTWRINNADRMQTLKSENDAGIWFNFGFKPSFSPADPQWGPDYIWGLPFLLSGSQTKQPMLLYTPAPVLRRGGSYSTEDIYRSFVELDMPIDYFEHVEYHFPDRVNELLEFVRYFDDIRNRYDYNFMTEPQMARSFLAAMTGSVRIERTWGIMLIDRVKDWLGQGKHLTLTLKPQHEDIPDLAGEYRNALGVVVEPGEKYAQQPFITDSDIFAKQDNRLYIGLRTAANVKIAWDKEPLHLVRANVPVDIQKTPNSWTIALNSEGMQQIKLYSPVPLAIDGENLKVEADRAGHTYTVTHFGEKTSVIVKW